MGSSTINICHLIIDGSSQWVVGRNVNRKCNIEHIDCNKVILPCKEDSIELVDFDFHSYIPYKKFLPDPDTSSFVTENKIYCATAKISQVLSRPWFEVKKIIDKVHKHVCGHSTYSDIKTLLERNKLWNAEVQKYLASTLDECTNCLATSKPKENRKVS